MILMGVVSTMGEDEIWRHFLEHLVKKLFDFFALVGEEAVAKISNDDFISIAYAQHTATQWLWRCNAERPNMDLGGITPYQKLAKVA